MKNNKIFFASIVVLLCVLAISTVTFAWFYFPTIQSINIETANDLPFDINLYELKRNSNNELRFAKVDIAENSDGTIDDTIKINSEFGFYQWGAEYICETELAQYYAIECLYNSNAYADGKLKVVIDFDDVSSSNYVSDEGVKYLNFMFANVCYAYCPNGSIDLTSAAAVTEAQSNKEGYYTLIEFEGESDSTVSEVVYDATIEQNIYDLKSSVYTNVYQKQSEDDEGIDTFRLIIFIKLEADEKGVADNLDGIEFGSLTELDIINALNIKISFRSIPQKTE